MTFYPITAKTAAAPFITATSITITISITLQCHPFFANSKSGAPSIQRTLGSLKTVLSALKAGDSGASSAQSLMHALGTLSSQGADDVASVISNFLEGLGSAAGISPESSIGPSELGLEARSQKYWSFLVVTSLQDGFDERSAPFTTHGEDTLFVDSLFQLEEEL